MSLDLSRSDSCNYNSNQPLQYTPGKEHGCKTCRVLPRQQLDGQTAVRELGRLSEKITEDGTIK